MPSEIYYFAYGSNMHPAQMLKRCPRAVFHGVLKLVNHELIFAGQSSRWGGAVASIRPHKGKAVWGIVFILRGDDIHQMDRYEGCYRSPGTSYPTRRGDSYSREIIEVMPDDEAPPNTRLPIAYQTYMLPEHVMPGKPSEAYLDHIVAAANFWNLPKPYVRRLRQLDTVSDLEDGVPHERVWLEPSAAKRHAARLV